jgi:hypothetical protein
MGIALMSRHRLTSEVLFINNHFDFCILEKKIPQDDKCNTSSKRRTYLSHLQK